MSGKPISVSEPAVSLEHLERMGWSNAELIWEQIQEEAARLWLGGGEEEARELWQGALDIAEAHFPPPDPRLVTSRVNAAKTSPAAAATEWAESEPWVEALKPGVRARSSMFHFRLRAKHPGGYEAAGRKALRSLFRQGLDQLQAAHATTFEQRLEQWKSRKPAGFNDYRKLLGAVLLLRAPG